MTAFNWIPAVCKLLLYDLANEFHISNIYSASQVGKFLSFQRVMAEYGESFNYLVISNGKEEEIASKKVLPCDFLFLNIICQES